jgi:hypothetical protein
MTPDIFENTIPDAQNLKIQSIQKKMAEWGERKKNVDTTMEAEMKVIQKKYNDELAELTELKVEIEEDAMELGLKRIAMAPFAYVIITGTGSFDWEKIAQSLHPSEELIDENTKTNWKAVAEGTGLVAEPIKQRYYTPPVKKHAELKLFTAKEIIDEQKTQQSNPTATA